MHVHTNGNEFMNTCSLVYQNYPEYLFAMFCMQKYTNSSILELDWYELCILGWGSHKPEGGGGNQKCCSATTAICNTWKTAWCSVRDVQEHQVSPSHHTQEHAALYG